MPTPPRLRLAITPLTEPGDKPLLARERFLKPRPPRRWRPWAWLAAVLLHVVVIGALLLLLRPARLQEAFEPTGVSVVYEPGKTTAQSPRPAPIPTPSQAPPPAAQPPQPTPPEQPEVNLNLPQSPLAALPAPQTQSTPQPPLPHPQTARRPRTPRYVVMNNMSLSAPPSPPSQFANKDLNLNTGGAPEDFANTPQISIQGDIGTDWQAGFNKWVNEHTYYPQAAAEQGQQGSATIEFTVHRDGSVTGVRLLRSAGSPFLDQAWMGIFLQNNVPPFPPGTKNDTITITATLNYELIQ